MEAFTGPDDRTLHVDRTAGTRGSKGPFHPVYTDRRGDTRWGYRCGNCKTVDNAVDAMGRVHCNECSNRTKAEDWDAVHE
jgi:hypothetical protein